MRTWIHDNFCCLTIKSDTGQHSQFLRCLFWALLESGLRFVWIRLRIFLAKQDWGKNIQSLRFLLHFVWDLYESGWGFAWQDKTVEKKKQGSKFEGIVRWLSCTLPSHNGTCPTQKYEYNLGKYTLEFEQIQIRFWRNTDYSLVMLYSCHAQCPPTMEHVQHRNMNIAWRNINLKKIAI